MPVMPYRRGMRGLNVIILYNNMPKIGAKWRDVCANMTQETAEKMAADMKRRAPVAPKEFEWSGYLRDSIVAEVVPGRRLQWRVVVHATYAHFVEFGTVNTPAQPFFIPARDRYYPQYVERIGDVIDAIPKRI